MTRIAPIDVERAHGVLDAALAQQPRGEQDRSEADRGVDEEDPLPADVLGEHPAEQDAHRAARARDGAPDGERLVALRCPRRTSSRGSRAPPARSSRRRGPGPRAPRSAGCWCSRSRRRARRSTNSPSPSMNSRRRPSRSAMRPPSSRNPPNVRAYALATHCRLDSVNSSSRWIVGSATLTIETSMMSMNCVAHSRMSAIQRRGSGTSDDMRPLSQKVVARQYCRSRRAASGG